jgi:hypothetical protein
VSSQTGAKSLHVRTRNESVPEGWLNFRPVQISYFNLNNLASMGIFR